MRIALIGIAFLLPSLTFAQVGIPGVDTLAISINPTYPRPGDTVLVTPQGSAIDLANSTMVVTVNGANTYSGNTRAVSVTLAPAGQTTTIRVTITGGGTSLSKTVSLKPGDVSLVIEPVSSAPALYAGKSLVGAEGTVRLVAVADLRTSPTARLDPDTLSYTWTVGDTTLYNASGIGRNSLTIPSPLQYRDTEVFVRVTNKDGSLVGGGGALVSTATPVLRIYENNPLRGILFDQALIDSHTLQGAEMTFTAVPYSFSLSKGLPIISWFLNNSAAQTGSDITLRPTGSGQGSASLSVTARQDSTYESGAAAISVLFGEKKSNFFGL